MFRCSEGLSLARVNAAARVGAPARAGAPSTSPHFAPGVPVLLLRPRELRGTPGVVRRRMTRGWEVEVRSPDGVPLHLTLPERALRLRT